MSIVWTDAKKWPDADRLAEMLSALGKIKTHPTDALSEVLPELLAILKVQRQGITELHAAVHTITRYNEATHAQFAQQIELVGTLVSAVKTQDKLIQKLTRRVDSLEKKLAKSTAAKSKPKKVGWFH